MARGSYRCVAIDDDAFFLRVIESYLATIKWIELIGAYSNPIEGAKAIERHNPDLVLIDFSMPYLDGLEVLETIEKKPVIIMISGNVRNQDIPVRVKKVVDKGLLKSPHDLEKVLMDTLNYAV